MPNRAQTTTIPTATTTTRTPSSPSTHPSSASKSPYVFYFRDFKKVVSNYFTCAIKEDTTESEDEDEYEIIFEDSTKDKNKSIQNDKTETTSSSIIDQPQQEQEPSTPIGIDTAMIDDRTTVLSQDELSAVVVMSYDQHGQLRSSSSVSSGMSSACVSSRSILSSVHPLRKTRISTRKFHRNYECIGDDDYDDGTIERRRNNKVKVLDRIKHQTLQEQAAASAEKHNEDTIVDDDRDQGGLSTTSSCQLVERLKNNSHNNKGGDGINNRGGHRGRSSNSSCGSSSKSSHRGRSYRLKQQLLEQDRQQTKLKAMNELAGFSLDRTSKSKSHLKKNAKTSAKAETAVDNDLQQLKGWLRRKTSQLKTKTNEKLKRNTKVGADASESVSLLSLSTWGSRSISNRGRQKTKDNSKDIKSNGENHLVNGNPVSILKKASYNNYNTTLLISGGASVTTHSADVVSIQSVDYPPEYGAIVVRFAEGTVFQDPNQLKRKKVPRLYKSRTMMRKQKKNSNHANTKNNSNNNILAFATQRPSPDPRSSLEATAMVSALVISGSENNYNNDSSCIPIEQMAPLVDEWMAATTSGMNCYVFR